MLSATADNNGNFATDFFTVPYFWQNSRQTFTVKSAGAAYDIPLTVTIGNFYPNIEPSTYYVSRGAGMTAKASGFAANEPVMLLVNGALATQQTADANGSAPFVFTAPSSGSSFTLTVEGSYSHVQSMRTITLH